MFLNGVMLAGVFAAVLPIVLHLLNRARYRKVEWGAMLFLEQTQTRHLNRSKLAQWILLAIRIAAIAVLALAFARPLTRRVIGPADSQRLATVIVIDASPSMGHPEQNSTRLELARKAALTILGRLGRGDQAGLVVLGRAADQDLALTTDLQDVATRLASLQTAYGHADQADGVRRANALLETGDVPREIYLIGDRQSSAWQPLSRIATESKRTRLVAVPVGSTDNLNVSIDSIELLDPPAIVGRAATVELRVRNWGSVARSELPLTLKLDETELDRTNLYLAPGATETVRRQIQIPRTGSVIISAAIAASGVPADDAAMLAIDVIEPIRVTIITGETPQQLAKSPAPDFSGQSDYLRLALTPFASAKQRGEDPFRVRVVSQDEWPELDPKKDRVVVLANVSNFDERKMRAIEQFVFGGGGVLVAPGSRTTPAAWNQWLWRDGQGIAPAPITTIQAAGEDVVRMVGVATDHPVFSFFAGRPDPLPPVNVMRWAKFSPVPSGSVLASLQSGDPMILYRTFGRGRVIAMAVSLDAGWSNFAWSNLYLPAMQSMMRYLGSSRTTDRNVLTGTAIEATVDSPRDRGATMTRPDGRVDRLSMSLSGGVGTVIYPDTDIPGKYTLRGGGGPIDFVVHGDSLESDLSLQSNEQLEPVVSQAGATLTSPEALGEVVGTSRRSTELSLGLIAAVLALLAAELVLAQRSIPRFAEAGA